MKTFRYVLSKTYKKNNQNQMTNDSIMGVHMLHFILSLRDTLNRSPEAGRESVFSSRTLQQSGHRLVIAWHCLCTYYTNLLY